MMEEKVKEKEKRALYAMIRRWVYMVVAIVAAMCMSLGPVLKFQDDKGIIYVRSFSMDEETFTVTQTSLETRAAYVEGTMSVKGLYYCRKAMLWGSILCLLCFFSYRWRAGIAILTAGISGAYYALLIYYAIRISDAYYATLYPTLMVVLPAVVLEMMVLVRHNVIQDRIDQADEE